MTWLQKTASVSGRDRVSYGSVLCLPWLACCRRRAVKRGRSGGDLRNSASASVAASRNPGFPSWSSTPELPTEASSQRLSSTERSDRGARGRARSRNHTRRTKGQRSTHYNNFSPSWFTWVSRTKTQDQGPYYCHDLCFFFRMVTRRTKKALVRPFGVAKIFRPAHYDQHEWRIRGRAVERRAGCLSNPFTSSKTCQIDGRKAKQAGTLGERRSSWADLTPSYTKRAG
jgi:hypothetical protein